MRRAAVCVRASVRASGQPAGGILQRGERPEHVLETTSSGVLRFSDAIVLMATVSVGVARGREAERWRARVWRALDSNR